MKKKEKNEKRKLHACMKDKSKDSVLLQVFRILDEVKVYEETLGTTQSWLSFNTDSCKLLAKGCSESSSDNFFNPHE